MTTTSELVCLHDIALSFPGLPTPNVSRSHLLRTANQILSDNSALFVEGQEEIGKTTFLAQFVANKPDQAFSIFLSPIAHQSYAPDQLRFDLANQIHWLMEGGRLGDDATISGELLRNYYMRLQRMGRRLGKTYYFVVDGLGALAGHSDNLVFPVLELLPFGVQGFKFVFAGGQDQLPDVYIKQIKSAKSFQLPFFSLPEATAILSGTELSEEDIHRVNEVTGGVPGSLAIVRRLLLDGQSLDEVLDGSATSAPAFLDMEWRRFDQSNLLAKRLLAFLIAAPVTKSAEVVAKHLGVDITAVSHLVERLTFLKFSESGRIQFVSESTRTFVTEKLKAEIRNVQSDLIAHFELEIDSPDAVLNLPELYSKTGQYEKLESLFRPEPLAIALRATNSILGLRQKAIEGAVFSKKAASYTGQIRFSILSTMLTGMLVSAPRRGLIDFLVSVDRTDDAISVVNAAFATEQRLHLLAFLGRKLYQAGKPIDPAIVQQIEALMQAVDCKESLDKSVAIVSDLVSFAPDLALKMVREIVENDSGNSTDWLVARLTQRALTDNQTADAAKEVVDKIASVVGSELGGKITTVVDLLLPSHTIASIRDICSKQKTTSEKVFFARLWLRTNRAHKEAHVLSLQTCREIVSDAAYSPNAGVYADIAGPLNFVKADETAEELHDLISGQLHEIRKVGPTTQYFQVRQSLIRYRSRRAGDWAENDVIELWADVDHLEIASAKLETLCQLYAFLVSEPQLREIDNKWNLLSETRAVIRNDARVASTLTAEHLESLRPAIEKLANADPELTLELVACANTVERRDELLRGALNAALDEYEPDENLAAVRTAFDYESRVQLTSTLSEVGGDVASWFERLSQEKKKEIIAKFETSIKRAFGHITYPPSRAEAWASLVAVYMAIGDEQKMRDAVREMEHAWEACSSPDFRVDGAFSLGAKLGAPVIEKSPIGEIIDEALAANVRCLEHAPTLVASLSVLASVAGVMFSAGQIGGVEEAELADLFRVVKDPLVEMQLWAYVVLRAAGRDPAKRNTEVAKDLYSKYLRQPLYNNLMGRPLRDGFSVDAAVRLSPVLWLINASTAKSLIECLDDEDRERAYKAILDYLLNGRCVGEEFEFDAKRGRRLTAEVINDAVEVLRLTTHEVTIWRCVRRITAFLRTGEGRNLSGAYRSDVLRKIKDICSAKLPAPDGIAHEGYKLLADAEILSTEKSSKGAWANIVDRASAIENKSDQVFILPYLIELLPNKEGELRLRCFNECVSRLKELPVSNERLERLRHFVSHAERRFRGELRRIVVDEHKLVISRPADLFEDSPEDQCRRMIDIAFSIDESFGESLASISDDDPARRPYLDASRKRFKELIEQRSIEKKEKGGDSSKAFKEYAKTLLGQLVAGASTRMDKEDVVDWLVNNRVDAIYKNESVLHLCVEVLASRYKQPAQISEHLRPLFESLRDSLIVCSDVFTGKLIRRGEELATSREPKDEVVLVSPGDVDVVDSVVSQWGDEVDDEEVIIVDQYFSPEDLRFILLIAERRRSLRYTVLTTRSNIDRRGKREDIRERFEEAWKDLGSNIEMPDVKIIVCESEGSGRGPIHDRWWLSGTSGLSFGTSGNAIGYTQISEVRRMTAADVRSRMELVEGFVRMKQRFFNGEKLKYDVCAL